MKYQIATTDSEPSLHNWAGEFASIEADAFGSAFDDWKDELIAKATSSNKTNRDYAAEIIDEAIADAHHRDDKTSRAMMLCITLMIISDDQETRDEARGKAIDLITPELAKCFAEIYAKQRADDELEHALQLEDY